MWLPLVEGARVTVYMWTSLDLQGAGEGSAATRIHLYCYCNPFLTYCFSEFAYVVLELHFVYPPAFPLVTPETSELKRPRPTPHLAVPPGRQLVPLVPG